MNYYCSECDIKLGKSLLCPKCYKRRTTMKKKQKKIEIGNVYGVDTGYSILQTQNEGYAVFIPNRAKPYCFTENLQDAKDIVNYAIQKSLFEGI
jgi:hypothetical protein